MTTIAEVLHRAADEFLWDGESQRTWDSDYLYSCDAIFAGLNLPANIRTRIKLGLIEMGLDAEDFYHFDDFRAGPQRQGARYAWLKFAAMIAEEQGV
jgi:hypothetical protein